MGECINIHIGGAGGAMGRSLWDFLACEFDISADGSASASFEEDRATVFREGENGKYRARAVFVDTDVHETFYHKNWDRRALVGTGNQIVDTKDDGGSCSFASRGQYTTGRSVSGLALDAVRKHAEACERLTALNLTCAIEGGVGSGTTCLLLERLRVAYGDKMVINLFPMLSSPQVTHTVVGPYNVLSTMESFTDYASVIYASDIEAIYKVCESSLDVERVDMAVVDNVHASAVGDVIASVAASRAVGGNLSWDSLTAQLVPFPRLQYVTLARTPFVGPEAAFGGTPSAVELLKSAAAGHGALSSYMKGRYQIESMSTKCLFRGDVTATDAYAAGASFASAVRMIDFVANPVSVSVCHKPTPVFCDSMTSSPRSVVIATNGLGIIDYYRKTLRDFVKVHQTRCFFHWYVGEGIDNGYLECPREHTEALIANLEDVFTPEVSSSEYLDSW